MGSNGSKVDFWKIMTAIIIPVLFFIGSSVIANDTSSRTRDDKLREEQTVATKEQTTVNQQILLALQDIKTEQRVTKELIKNGK